MKKKKVSEQQEALWAMQEAQEKYFIAERNFNTADPEFFDIANAELTIAKLSYELCLKKLRKLCENGEYPIQSPFYGIYSPYEA